MGCAVAYLIGRTNLIPANKNPKMDKERQVPIVVEGTYHVDQCLVLRVSYIWRWGSKYLGAKSSKPLQIPVFTIIHDPTFLSVFSIFSSFNSSNFRYIPCGVNALIILYIVLFYTILHYL